MSRFCLDRPALAHPVTYFGPNDDISELKELWEEDGDLPLEWYSVLDNLAARLQ